MYSYVLIVRFQWTLYGRFVDIEAIEYFESTIRFAETWFGGVFVRKKMKMKMTVEMVKYAITARPLPKQHIIPATSWVEHETYANDNI